MKIFKLIGISEEDYNTALFEIGCEILEERYGHQNSQIIMQQKGCWNWMRAQRDIADENLYNVLKSHKMPEQAGKIYKLYHRALRAHLGVVYFPERLENKLLEKEVWHG